MEELIKSLKNKLMVTKEIAQDQAKAEDVVNNEDNGRTGKLNTDQIVEVANHMNEISANGKMAASEGDEQKPKTSHFNILSKYKQTMNVDDDDEDDNPLGMNDDVSFLD